MGPPLNSDDSDGIPNFSPKRIFIYLNREVVNYFFSRELVERVSTESSWSIFLPRVGKACFNREFAERFSTESLQNVFPPRLCRTFFSQEFAQRFSAESWQSSFQPRVIISILQPGIHILNFSDLLRFCIILVLQATNFYFYQGIFLNPCFGRLLFFSSNTFYEN